MIPPARPLPSDAFFPRPKAAPGFEFRFEGPHPLYLEEFVYEEKDASGTVIKRTPNYAPGFQTQDVSIPEAFGHELNLSKGDLFSLYIKELLDRVRHFNIALYRSRRARFIIDSHNTMTLQLPRIPTDTGDLDFPDPMPTDPTTTQTYCTEIDKEYNCRLRELRHWLIGLDDSTIPPTRLEIPDGSKRYFDFDGYVDVVAVNGFILSVRIAADVSASSLILAAPRKFLQPGYQSSSHISISSRFSSP